MNHRIEMAKFLKEKRSIASLKQSDVAKALGYSTSQFISNWERGISSPPVFILKKLSKLYQFSLQEIFTLLMNQREEELRRELFSERRAKRAK